jgi:hypothetical protein
MTRARILPQVRQLRFEELADNGRCRAWSLTPGPTIYPFSLPTGKLEAPIVSIQPCDRNLSHWI